MPAHTGHLKTELRLQSRGGALTDTVEAVGVEGGEAHACLRLSLPAELVSGSLGVGASVHFSASRVLGIKDTELSAGVRARQLDDQRAEHARRALRVLVSGFAHNGHDQIRCWEAVGGRHHPLQKRVVLAEEASFGELLVTVRELSIIVSVSMSETPS